MLVGETLMDAAGGPTGCEVSPVEPMNHWNVSVPVPVPVALNVDELPAVIVDGLAFTDVTCGGLQGEPPAVGLGL